MAPAPELEAPSQHVLPSKGRGVHHGQSPINILNALFRPHTLLNRIITLVTAETHPQSGKSHWGSVFRAGTGSVKHVNSFISLDTTSHRGRQDELAQVTNFCKQTRQARAESCLLRERLTGRCPAEETQSPGEETHQTRGLLVSSKRRASTLAHPTLTLLSNCALNALARGLSARGWRGGVGPSYSCGLLLTSWPQCLRRSGIFIACCLSDNVQA